MELRNVEKEVNELQHLYESICQTKVLEQIDNETATSLLSSITSLLPPIVVNPPTGDATTQQQDNQQQPTGEEQQEPGSTALEEVSKEEKQSSSSPMPLSIQKRSYAETLSLFETLQKRVSDLEPRTERFRARLNEKDPITGAPRYGENTFKRVQTLLQIYDSLVNGINIAFNTEAISGEESAGTSIVNMLRLCMQRQEMTAREMESRERERLRREQEEKEKQELLRLEEERKKQEEERMEQLERERQIAERAEAVRQAQRRAQEQAEREQQEWLDSIKKGADGVQQQLDVLCEATANEPASLIKALDALFTLFNQIVSKPEEPNFRRIRRDHPKFHEDIGRHRGGREILIAAGFELGEIDEVPCFITKEPDIEKDMDGWANWFDLLKASLKIVEQRRQQCTK